MILPLGLSVSIPSTYEGIKKRLRDFGLSPTGNVAVDRARLLNAIKQKEQKYEDLKKELKLEEEKKTENPEKQKLEEEKLGAQLLAEQKRLYFGI